MNVSFIDHFYLGKYSFSLDTFWDTLDKIPFSVTVWNMNKNLLDVISVFTATWSKYFFQFKASFFLYIFS